MGWDVETAPRAVDWRWGKAVTGAAGLASACRAGALRPGCPPPGPPPGQVRTGTRRYDHASWQRANGQRPRAPGRQGQPTEPGETQRRRLSGWGRSALPQAPPSKDGGLPEPVRRVESARWWDMPDFGGRRQACPRQLGGTAHERRGDDHHCHRRCFRDCANSFPYIPGVA